MKKLLAFAALILSVFTFSACGNSALDLAGLEVKIPAGQTSTEYISPEVSTSEFNAWFIKFSLEGTGEAALEVRFGNLAEWTDVELEGEDGLLTGFALTEPNDSYQFRLRLDSASSLTHQLNGGLTTQEQAGETGLRAYAFQIETQNLEANDSWNLIPDASAKLTDIGIISREDWGANPDYLLDRETPASSGTLSEAWKIRQQKCNELVEKYPAEFEKSAKVITVDNQNRELYWVNEYSQAIEKLIIHSTATDGEKDLNGDSQFTVEDAEAAVRAIYYYHAMFKGWGDIGYHYLIDPFGNIYEGKNGGEYVIGAHAYCANTGTIGIRIRRVIRIELKYLVFL